MRLPVWPFSRKPTVTDRKTDVTWQMFLAQWRTYFLPKYFPSLFTSLLFNPFFFVVLVTQSDQKVHDVGLYLPQRQPFTLTSLYYIYILLACPVSLYPQQHQLFAFPP